MRAGVHLLGRGGIFCDYDRYRFHHIHQSLRRLAHIAGVVGNILHLPAVVEHETQASAASNARHAVASFQAFAVCIDPPLPTGCDCEMGHPGMECCKGRTSGCAEKALQTGTLAESVGSMVNRGTLWAGSIAHCTPLTAGTIDESRPLEDRLSRDVFRVLIPRTVPAGRWLPRRTLAKHHQLAAAGLSGGRQAHEVETVSDTAAGIVATVPRQIDLPGTGLA